MSIRWSAAKIVLLVLEPHDLLSQLLARSVGIALEYSAADAVEREHHRVMVVVREDRVVAHSACSAVEGPDVEAVREGIGFPACIFRDIFAICLCTVLVLPW